MEWSNFRELGMKCNEGDLTPIYSEHPLFYLPSCSLISSYQFTGKTPKQHALLLSGNNPALLRNFREGLQVESYYYKNNEWIFVCKFAAPVAARYLQFVCDESGNATCLDRLTISGCPIANSWCKAQLFKTVIEEYHVKRDFLKSSLGQALLKTTIMSALTPFWMFIVGRYNLDGKLIKLVLGFLQRLTKSKKHVGTEDDTAAKSTEDQRIDTE
ncbi:hypothetical protein OS493_003043 [Desmophyllum pertusum]|uniref:Uncharacterized protein n=1 Tax=Desmophyllum pertusum TaxID=174260 RepID=A0A9X0CH28_9CNID|nr:hypothetical protein OS493_003043 [Desmophyllum pertusum]